MPVWHQDDYRKKLTIVSNLSKIDPDKHFNDNINNNWVNAYTEHI